MKVYRNSGDLPSFHNAVLTIGTFDGVHTGHQQIIEQMKDEARRIGGETVIVTFDPHPRKIIQGPSSIKMLNTLDEKIELLASRGIDHLVIEPFTEDFSHMSAEAYVDRFLVGKFKPSTIIIGYDHRFGRDRTGDFHLLEDLRSKYGYTLLEIPVHVLHAVSVSSTRIREAVAKGDIEEANELLGYDYHFDGTVVEGNKLGRSLGFPTANLKLTDDEKLLPGTGVYVATAQIRDPKNPENQSARLKGMMNIGFRPTVGGKSLTVEIHLFDFDQDIYGKTLRVSVKVQLRPETQFNGLDALKAQLEKDRELAKYILNMMP